MWFFTALWVILLFSEIERPIVLRRPTSSKGEPPEIQTECSYRETSEYHGEPESGSNNDSLTKVGPRKPPGALGGGKKPPPGGFFWGPKKGGGVFFPPPPPKNPGAPPKSGGFFFSPKNPPPGGALQKKKIFFFPPPGPCL
ncbi:MAG: hypothetical protein CM15mP78_08820 [Candidatus Poseidoniales archaeon]|nr:MAG: hypothetical protein CM15mP78_08820 [Candidatus Poseidoniales archaeon]